MLPVTGSARAGGEVLAPSESSRVAAVINEYFTALAGGDVTTLESLLGGRLKTKRTPLLGNPDYASYLATTYMDATIDVLDISGTAPDTVSVDVHINFSSDETVHKLYTLKRDTSGTAAAPYLIINEAAVAD